MSASPSSNGHYETSPHGGGQRFSLQNVAPDWCAEQRKRSRMLLLGGTVLLAIGVLAASLVALLGVFRSEGVAGLLVPWALVIAIGLVVAVSGVSGSRSRPLSLTVGDREIILEWAGGRAQSISWGAHPTAKIVETGPASTKVGGQGIELPKWRLVLPGIAPVVPLSDEAARALLRIAKEQGFDSSRKACLRLEAKSSTAQGAESDASVVLWEYKIGTKANPPAESSSG